MSSLETIMTKLFFLTLLPILSVVGVNENFVKLDNVITSSEIGNITVYHKAQKFYVEKNDHHHEVKQYDVDKKIRAFTPEQLMQFKKIGYFHLKQMNNGDYSLSAHARGLGGGPVSAVVAAWTTRVIGLGGFIVAAYHEPSLWTEIGHASTMIEYAANAAETAAFFTPLP